MKIKASHIALGVVALGALYLLTKKASAASADGSVLFGSGGSGTPTIPATINAIASGVNPPGYVAPPITPNAPGTLQSGAQSIVLSGGDVSAAIAADHSTGNLINLGTNNSGVQYAPVSAASEAWFQSMVAKK